MRKLVASCSAVLIAAAGLAACGGSSGSSKGAGNTTTSNGGASGGSSSNDELSKLLADVAKQRFKITYSSLAGSAEAYAQDGHGKSVYGPPEARIYTSPSGAVSCARTSGGTVACTPLPSGYSSASPFLGYVKSGKSYLNALGGHGSKSTTTIAGRTAECVTFSAGDLPGAAGVALGAALKGSATYCVDKDTGVLLAISGTDGSGGRSNPLTVTKWEEPSDADFTPPATPSSIPTVTMPGGG
jgi:hypothetical protein